MAERAPLSLACAVLLVFLAQSLTAAPRTGGAGDLYDKMSPMGRLAHQKARIKAAQAHGHLPTAKISGDTIPNGDDGDNDGPSGGQAEVSLAVDPTGQHIVVGYNDTRGFFISPLSVSGIAYSDDGGATFTDAGQLPAQGNTALNGSIGTTKYPEVFGDPDIKYVPGGTGLQFIYASIMVKGLGTAPTFTSTAQTLCILTSTNGGHSWQGPYEITPATNPNSTGDAADKEFIDVDPDTGRVIVSWSNFTSSNPGGVEISTTFSDNIMSGNPPSWSTRNVLNAGASTFDTGSIPRFAGNLSNEVYVAWSRSSSTTGTSYSGSPYTRTAFARSTDNGVTWNTAVNLSSDTFPIDYIPGNDRVHSFPGLAVDTSSGARKGNVYTVYVGNGNHDGGDIAFQRSTDRGVSFSSPVFLNSRPGSDRAQWFPYVAVDPDTGRIHVIYDDQGIAKSGDLMEMTWTYSDDGGLTWSKPAPLTSRPFRGGYGNDTGQPNLGDYNGATARGGSLFAAFTTTPEISPFTAGQPASQFPYPSFLPGLNPVGFRKLSSAPAALRLGQVTFSENGGNGFLDPGDIVSLTIPLENYVTNSISSPGSFTGVSAILATTNVGVLVTTSTQSYSAISPGASVSNTTAFGVTLQPGFVAGTRIQFTLSLTTDQGSSTLSFSLTTGTPVATTIFSENFTSVSPGSLPVNWSTAHLGGNNTVPWTTSSSVPGAPGGNALFHANAKDGGADSTRWERVFSPQVTIPANASYATLDFDAWYNTEDDPDFNTLAYDGFLLTLVGTSRSCLAEAFAEDMSTGLLQQYPKHLPRNSNTAYFQDMSVWGGYSGGWQHVHLKLPGVAGSSLQLRWDFTQDNASTGTDVHPTVLTAGVAVDNIVIQSVVSMATPGLTWTNPLPITYGAPLNSTQLNASASVPGTFVYSPATGSVLSAGAHALSVVFTPTDSAHYLSVTSNVSQAVLPAPLSAVAAGAARSYGQSNPAFSVTLTGVTNGDNISATASCSATPASTVGLYPIVPSLLDPNNSHTNYQVSLVNGALLVSPAAVPLTWTNPSAITYGTPLGSTQLAASTSVAGSYNYTPPNGTVLGAGTNTLSVTFTPTDALDYSNAAASVSLVVLDSLVYHGIDLTDAVQALADNDGDGFQNLLEYALGTDPGNPADVQQAFLVSVSSGSGGDFLSMQFKRRKSSPGLPLLYTPEVSSDRVSWFSDASNVGTPVVTPLDSVFDWVTVTDQVATVPAAPRFIRLRVTSF